LHNIWCISDPSFAWKTPPALRNSLKILGRCAAFGRGWRKLSIVSAAKNPDFLRRAIQLATENVVSGKGGPFGAVIVRDGRIVGEGVNTVTAGCDPTAHAEVNAIRAAARNLNEFSLQGCTLYTSCQPCPMCLSAAYWARVDAIVYGASAADAAAAGFDDAFLYAEFRKEQSERQLSAEQMLGEEARASFTAWMESASKIPY
jgi:tRNA(Arg) A34 adenosine deaminase TadA